MPPESNDESKLKPITYQLRVRPETRALVEELAEKTGASNVEIAARMTEWFVRQPWPFQRAVMERDEEALDVLLASRLGAATLLDAARTAEQFPIETAAKAAHALIDRMLTAYRFEVAHAELAKKPKSRK